MEITKRLLNELQGDSELNTIQERIIKQQTELIDTKLNDFFNPYFRKVGIKGEITKGKIKWRGIKMKVRNNLNSTDYQLNQRGIDISPVFTINF
jgi:hypothetical protein